MINLKVKKSSHYCLIHVEFISSSEQTVHDQISLFGFM